MTEVTIGALRPYQDRGWPTVSAIIDVAGHRHHIFFRASQGPLAAGPEPFIAVALLPAMKLGLPLRVDGAVTPRFLAHTRRVQEILCSWLTDLHAVHIECGRRADVAVLPAPGVASLFSGGVDSFFTVYKHIDEITHLVFVHGFDILLANAPLRKKVSAAIHRAAAELGKPVIEMETNVRDVLDPYAPWPTHTVGAALVSIGLLLSPQIGTLYVAGGFDYNHPSMVSNDPLVVQTWSAPETEIVDDGREATRYEKIARLAESDTAMRYLRVCWENRNGAYNCGQCPKCLHTMIFLELSGALQRCQTFDRPLDLDLVRRTVPVAPGDWGYEREALALVESRGDHADLAQALRASLEQSPSWADTQTPHVACKQGRLMELEAKLYQVTSSRSWRFTAPLRSISEAWRSARGRNKR